MSGVGGIAETFLHLWEEAPADGELKRSSRRACKALRKFGGVFPPGRSRAWFCEGWFRDIAGDPGRARRAWERCIAAGEEFGMPYDTERARQKA